MTVCNNCKQQIEDASKFCPFCGAKTEQEQAKAEMVEETEVVAEPEAVEEPEVVEESEAIAEPEAADEVEEIAEPETATDSESLVIADASNVFEGEDQETVKDVVEEVAEEAVEEAMEEAAENALTDAGFFAEDAVPESVSAVQEADSVQLEAPDELFGAGDAGVGVDAAAGSAQPFAVVGQITKETIKAQKKALVQAKKAMKDNKKKAKKAAADDKKAEYKGPKKTLTLVGVIAAVFLTAFLVVNLALVYASFTGAGIAAADMSNYSVNVAGQEYSFDAFIRSFEGEGGENALALIEEIAMNESVIINLGDGYQITLDPAIVDTANEIVYDAYTNRAGIAGEIREAVREAKEGLFVSCISVGGYAVLVCAVITACIMFCLSKLKRAFMLPGIVMTLCGLGFLTASVIAMVAPAAFGFTTALFSAVPVLVFDLVIPGVIAVVGVILTIIGACARKGE